MECKQSCPSASHGSRRKFAARSTQRLWLSRRTRSLNVRLRSQDSKEFYDGNVLVLPIVRDEQGRKLGKREGSDPVAQQSPLEAFGAALAFPGHPPPRHDDLDQRRAWAVAHWDPERIPRRVIGRTGPDGQTVYCPD